MLILKDKKKQEVRVIFPTVNDLINYIGENNDKINISNSTIVDLINSLYYKMLNDDGIIKFIRFSRWYPKEMGFKKKNVLQLEFWLERGWSDYEAKGFIKNMMHERSSKGAKTRNEHKNTIIIDGLTRFKYKTVEFELEGHPKCNCCGFDLKLKKVNIKNKVDEFYYKIETCSNDDCESHNMVKTDKYKAYLPEDVSNVKIENLSEIIAKSNPLCVNYWLNKGFNLEDAKNKISGIQRYNSKQVKTHHGKSKKMLRERGYSEEEIKEICLTPANTKFWVKKGYSEDEANKIISKNQSIASKNVDYKKRLLPSNIDYWIKRGFSYTNAKEAVRNHQTTFSKEKCIEKYGEEEGLRIFTERQHKWNKSLINNGKLKMGYSNISQELFYKLLDSYNINDKEYVYFATHNKEYKLEKEEGGVWLYDFTDTINKKMIEYHGDDYHGNPKKYLAEDHPHPFRKNITAQEMWDKDKRKLNVANEEGFEVLVIWDSEYRWGNKQEIIDKCLDFLGKK